MQRYLQVQSILCISNARAQFLKTPHHASLRGFDFHNKAHLEETQRATEFLTTEGIKSLILIFRYVFVFFFILRFRGRRQRLTAARLINEIHLPMVELLALVISLKQSPNRHVSTQILEAPVTGIPSLSIEDMTPSTRHLVSLQSIYHRINKTFPSLTTQQFRG